MCLDVLVTDEIARQRTNPEQVEEEILNSQGTTKSEQLNLLSVAKEEQKKKYGEGPSLLRQRLDTNGLAENTNSDESESGGEDPEGTARTKVFNPKHSKSGVLQTSHFNDHPFLIHFCTGCPEINPKDGLPFPEPEFRWHCRVCRKTFSIKGKHVVSAIRAHFKLDAHYFKDMEYRIAKYLPVFDPEGKRTLTSAERTELIIRIEQYKMLHPDFQSIDNLDRLYPLYGQEAVSQRYVGDRPEERVRLQIDLIHEALARGCSFDQVGGLWSKFEEEIRQRSSIRSIDWTPKVLFVSFLIIFIILR